MRKIFSFLITTAFSLGLLAQVPQTISYQAVIRDADNNILANQPVGMQISIVHGSAIGSVVYSETHTLTTNENGLLEVEIGAGAGFATIDWANGPYFIKTYTDPSGGSNYSLTTTSQFITVPYAAHARRAEIISGEIPEADPLFTAAFDIDNAQTGDLIQFDGEKWIKVPSDFSEPNHAHPGATETENGFITAEDKIKLDRLQNSDGSETIVVSGTEIIVTGEGTADMPYIIGFTDGIPLGEMRYWDGSEWIAIPPGETDMVLTICNGVPVWGPCSGKAVVNVLGVTNITKTTASVNANVVNDGGSEVTERGICYSTNSNPTTADNKIPAGTGIGTFSANLTGLLPQTFYYVRGYAINSQGTSYSDQIGFTTEGVDFSSVSDADNNVYRTVTIGSQQWMAENLKTTKYTDGTDILNLTGIDDWNYTFEGAYVLYNNDYDIGNIYGAMYNWYALDRGICPVGWRPPTEADWTELTNYIINNYSFGGMSVGKALKSCRQVNSPLGGGCSTSAHPRWDSHDTSFGTDNFGFSALPGGNRAGDGIHYSGLGYWSFWWSHTASGPDHATARTLYRESNVFPSSNHHKRHGFYVRCLKE